MQSSSDSLWRPAARSISQGWFPGPVPGEIELLENSAAGDDRKLPPGSIRVTESRGVGVNTRAHFRRGRSRSAVRPKLKQDHWIGRVVGLGRHIDREIVRREGGGKRSGSEWQISARVHEGGPAVLFPMHQVLGRRIHARDIDVRALRRTRYQVGGHRIEWKSAGWKRTSKGWPAAHGGPLNKATRGWDGRIDDPRGQRSGDPGQQSEINGHRRKEDVRRSGGVTHHHGEPGTLLRPCAVPR